jgi:hypothetical protein
MALHTAFTELCSVRHPIALAPMAEHRGHARGGRLERSPAADLVGALAVQAEQALVKAVNQGLSGQPSSPVRVGLTQITE